MSSNPEDSSAGWPSFGEHLKIRTKSTYKRGQSGVQVNNYRLKIYELINLIRTMPVANIVAKIPNKIRAPIDPVRC